MDSIKLSRVTSVALPNEGELKVNESILKQAMSDLNELGLLIVDGATGCGKTTFLAYIVKNKLKDVRVYNVISDGSVLEGLIKSQETDKINFVRRTFLDKLCKLRATEGEVVVIDALNEIVQKGDFELLNVIEKLLNMNYKVVVSAHTSFLTATDLTRKVGYTHIVVDKREDDFIRYAQTVLQLQ